MRKRTNFVCIFASACLMLSCGQSEETPTAAPNIPIRWSVSSVSGGNARTLINESEDLQNVCTDNESIALWGNYTYEGRTVEVFANDSLSYWNKPNGNPYSQWNYNGADRYWQTNASYHFRACFPQKALKGFVSADETQSLTIDYDTETLQEDLLAAYEEINAATWNLSQPVPLNMQHALSTIQLKFKMKEGATTQQTLTSVWMDNDALKTKARFIYDSDTVTNENWQNFSASTSNLIYLWKNKGMTFSAGTTATAYTEANTTTTGKEYCSNEGHVFIIPQTCSTAPTIHFNTKRAEYRDISLGTTQFNPGKKYIYTIEMTDDEVTVTLSIKDWNELHSSYDITF